MQVANRNPQINSNNVGFLDHYSNAIVKHEGANQNALPACTILPGDSVNFDANQNRDIMNPNYPLSCVEMIDSEAWLKKYGLKTNRLTFENILGNIGFKQTQDYINQFKRNITSKYSQGLFLQTQSKDGNIYNITVNEEKLVEIANRLEQVIRQYQMRLQWLNTNSRRLFGVMIEQSACLVLDCKQKDQIKFNQYRNCILKLLREQVAKLLSFNIIRCSDTIQAFRDKAVVVSGQSIEEATEWLNEWSRSTMGYSNHMDTSTSEAVMQAFQDRTVECVYLISEGQSSNGSREILFDKLIKESNEKRIRLNVVSFDCMDISTVEYLKRLASNSYGIGRFHAYCLLRQYDDFSPGPIDADPTKSKVFKNKRTFGGAPPGAGIKNDIMLVFEEVQLAKETLESLKRLIDSMSKANGNSNKSIFPTTISDNKKQKIRDEEYLTSKDWLLKHGLKARKLDIFDILNQVCFRHCDGVVDLKKEPITGRLFFVGEGVRYYQGDSIPRSKLVNAKYCDQFAHVLWSDGTILHVHVTPDLHRNYEHKIKIELEKYERRIDWLSKGSRELFGTVIENNICILIDTSQSMQMSLDFVKRKLCILMQEQLKSKQRFNLVSFNSKIYPWRDRMVEVDEFNTSSALDWVNNLNAQGTTNTLGAIRFALADLNTEAIYLLSDGRPDQEPRQILSQVHLNTKIPIHTISFNCNDSEANKFLSQLARETNGRYHYFNESGWDADPDGPIPYQSEDTHLLKQEIEKGLRFLSQIAELREECARLTTNSNSSEKNENSFQSKYDSKNSYNASKMSDVKGKKSVLSSLHDIQSLDWILPETRQLLERQFKNQVMKPNKQINEISSKTTQVLKSAKPKPLKLKSIDLTKLPLKQNYSRIKKWLEKNSLAALKLTLFDLILEKKNLEISSNNSGELANKNSLYEFQESKVYNDILELASVSNVDKSQLKFLNPEKINFPEYEGKLKRQIELYQKFLTDKIWDVLPEREKELLNIKELKIIDDLNRDLIIDSLEHSNWPIAKEDFNLVETQIEQAKTYIKYLRNISDYLSQIEAKKKLSQAKTTTVDIGEKEDISTKNYEENSQNTNRESDFIESSRKTLNTSRSNLEKFEELMSSNTKKEDKLSRGDKVIARNDLLGYYYSGRVSKVVDSRHANIKFDKGPKQISMSIRNIIKFPSVTPYLSLGDYVMACVVNEFEQTCWVPGIIQSIDQISYTKMFTVLYFNGQEGENTRQELYKITRNTYGFIVNYIRSRLGINTQLKQHHEETKIIQPEQRPPTPPDIDELKKDIVDSIKLHFDSLRLDDKYQRMYEELQYLRKKNKSLRYDLEGKFKVLRQDFDEWKSQEPPVILPDPNKYIYQTHEEIDKYYIKHHKKGAKNRDREKINKSPPNNRKEKSPELPIDFSKSIEPNVIITKTPELPPSNLTLEQKLRKLAKELPELQEGEEVLARWPDDGWYYRSIVKKRLDDYKYEVEDSLKDSEIISREDIISEINDSSIDAFEVGDPVVALHPHYEFSYAPGQIVQISNDMNKLLIRFYDFVDHVIFREEVYKLPRIKFQLDINAIIELEKRWIGQTVVARNNYSNVYELGKIVSRVGNGRQYTIEWSNGNQTIQNANHIFGTYTRNPAIIVNDYVLAPKETIFLPGRVVGKKGNQLRVKFVDGIIDENINVEDCYWLSRDYYDDCCWFYKKESDPYLIDNFSVGNKKHRTKENEEPAVYDDKGRTTPIIDANDFHTGKSNKVKYPKGHGYFDF